MSPVNKTCLGTCPDGYWNEGGGVNKCTTCVSTCAVCDKNTAGGNNCLKCIQGLFLADDATCVL
jgi:hypothetical protein